MSNICQALFHTSSMLINPVTLCTLKTSYHLPSILFCSGSPWLAYAKENLHSLRLLESSNLLDMEHQVTSINKLHDKIEPILKHNHNSSPRALQPSNMTRSSGGWVSGSCMSLWGLIPVPCKGFSSSTQAS